MDLFFLNSEFLLKMLKLIFTPRILSYMEAGFWSLDQLQCLAHLLLKYLLKISIFWSYLSTFGTIFFQSFFQPLFLFLQLLPRNFITPLFCFCAKYSLPWFKNFKMRISVEEKKKVIFYQTWNRGLNKEIEVGTLEIRPETEKRIKDLVEKRSRKGWRFRES